MVVLAAFALVGLAATVFLPAASQQRGPQDALDPATQHG
jgi:hypothetical protein